MTEQPKRVDQISLSRTRAKVELARRELSRRSLMQFIKYNFYEYHENWHHALIAEALERVERGEIKRLAIFMPPRHGKSELCSVQFPAWYLGRNPRKEIISVSYSAELAMDFGRKVRNIVTSMGFGNVFPSSALSETSRATDNWHMKLGGGYLACGIGGSITGKGAHILIIDDPIKSRKDADSELIRNITYNWYQGTAYTRLAPDGAIILIQTRWHDADLAGRLERHPEWRHWHKLILPAIATQDEIVEGKWVRKQGEALWPDRYGLKELDSIKASIGSYEWSSQYQQNPIDEASQEFYREWFQSRSEEEVKKLNVRRFLTVDTAGKMTATSDYIGMVDNRVDQEGKWNLIARKYKMNPADFVNYLFVLQKKNNYEIIGIEKTIFTDALEPYIMENEMKTGIIMPIKLLKHQGKSKELRVRGLIPYYQNGKIYHVEGQCEELESQLLRFPKSAEWDVSDAASYQVQVAQAPFGWENADFPIKDEEKRREFEMKERKISGQFDKHSPISTLDI